MKKQLLIAAVAASMTSVAMADISISGAAKVNNNEGTTTMEADLKVTGKSGATSVVANISLDSNDGAGVADVEQLYAKSAIAGVSVKAGNWKGGKSELGYAGGNDKARVNVSTSFGGVKIAWEDQETKDSSATVSGTIGGIAISHKSQGEASETKASGNVGGVSAKMHQKINAADATNTSVTLSTSVQGVSLTYVDVKNDAASDMDGFFGKHGGAGASAKGEGKVTAANGFGLSTDVAGNKVTFKNNDITGASGTEVNQKKVIVTRKLASGATFEATYVNAATNSLDLELAVKF